MAEPSRATTGTSIVVPSARLAWRRWIVVAALAPILAGMGVAAIAGGGVGAGGGLDPGGVADPGGVVHPAGVADSGGFVGSASCRECHSKEHALWSTSHHAGTARPFTVGWARDTLAAQTEPLAVGEIGYRVVVGDDGGRIVESGPRGERSFPIAMVLGGRDVVYPLVSLERGRLQTAPVAFDVARREWLDMAAAGLRHLAGERDAPYRWTDWPFVFPAQCADCHMTGYSAGYNLEADSYTSQWAEAGVACESCHGPCGEHVRLFRPAAHGGDTPSTPALSIVAVSRGATARRASEACAPCHAKRIPISAGFEPGDDFFDHYDLVAFENPDFHPDGRDLGENYTYTGWLLSPCAQSGQLDCLHCHTSSGRYRFDGGNANQACMPCHADKTTDPSAHSHHSADGPGSLCVSCHMPKTLFARMRRSDHSMRPPTPAATIEFGSPNACALCHADRDARWADERVREWHQRDYQKPVLERTRLIAAAREGRWNFLPAMLNLLARSERDEVTAVSLVRLLEGCDDERKRPVLIRLAAEDPSPLVRAAAVTGLKALAVSPADPSSAMDAALRAMVKATRDPRRLVRVRAAAALAAVPVAALAPADRESLAKAVDEFTTGLRARPDDASAHYALGNFHLDRGEYESAAECFENALHLRDDFAEALIHSSLALHALGRAAEAKAALERACRLAPRNEAAQMNRGMLLGELGETEAAEAAFRSALEANPRSARGAFNLALCLSEDRPDEALSWLREAVELAPAEPRYAYALAFHLQRRGYIKEAIVVLRSVVDAARPHADAHRLLGSLYEKQGNSGAAREVYRLATNHKGLPDSERLRFLRLLSALPDDSAK